MSTAVEPGQRQFVIVPCGPGLIDDVVLAAAVVRRDVGVEALEDRQPGRGQRVGVRRVHGAGRLRVAAGQVDVHVLARDLDASRARRCPRCRARRSRSTTRRRRCRRATSLISSPRALEGVAADRLGVALDLLEAVALDRLQQAALADPDRALLREQVAAQLVRVAQVGEDHREDVLAELAAVPDLERRKREALGPDVRREVGHARRPRRADVEVVDLDRRPEAELVADEHGGRDDDVADVAVAAVRVVADHHVAVADVALEAVRDLLEDDVHAADVQRRPLVHRDQARLAVEHRAREVAGQRQDRRPGGVLQRHRHLVDDRDVAPRQHRERGRVDALDPELPGECATRVPLRSTSLDPLGSRTRRPERRLRAPAARCSLLGRAPDTGGAVRSAGRAPSPRPSVRRAY